MPVGWVLVGDGKKTHKVNMTNLRKIQKLADKAGKPWARRVKFKVNAPLRVHWSSEGKPREWQAVVEIDGVRKSKATLEDIFDFIATNCSHSDGVG